MTDDTIVIADTQVHKGVPIDHLEALSQYIWKHKPAHIVHIGDHFDFPSLSKYASAYEREGMRLHDDFMAGIAALRAIMQGVEIRNRVGKKKAYRPNMQFILGNHEFRLERYIQENPALHGLFDLPGMVRHHGWDVHEYLVPYWLDGICYSHYMPNPESSRPVGGSIENKLNKFPHSFIHGHQQKYQYGRRQNLEGRPHFGICAGSFYMHDEGYRGANNTEIRGFVHLRPFKNRYNFLDHDAEFVSMERLLQMQL